MDQQPQSPSVPSDGSALDSSEKGTKKSGKVLPIILILVALAGVGFGIYGMFMFLKPEPKAPACPTCVSENTEKTEEQESQEKTSPTEQTNDNLSISRSFDNVVNNKSGDYYNQYYEIEATTITVNDNNGDRNYDYYYINCNHEICKVFNQNGDESATIDNFQGKIKDFYYMLFGQGYGDEKLYFVMEDGSVEYIPVDKAFNAKNIKSYGKIAELNNIVKIHQVTSESYDNENNQLVGGGASALAEDKDGNLYDLYKINHPSE